MIIAKHNRFLQVLDLILDSVFFHRIYYLSVKEENVDKVDYKWASLITFIAILSPFWIAYSGLVSMTHISGRYEKFDDQNKGACSRLCRFIGRFFFLSFMGPFLLLICQIILSIGDIVSLLAAFFFGWSKQVVRLIAEIFENAAAEVLKINTH